MPHVQKSAILKSSILLPSPEDRVNIGLRGRMHAWKLRIIHHHLHFQKRQHMQEQKVLT